MDLQDALYFAVIGDHDDIGFLAHSNLVPNRVDAFVLLVCVESKVVISSIGQSVTVICIQNTLSVFLESKIHVVGG